MTLPITLSPPFADARQPPSSSDQRGIQSPILVRRIERAARAAQSQTGQTVSGYMPINSPFVFREDFKNEFS
jgi:hypothetical protein